METDALDEGATRPKARLQEVGERERIDEQCRIAGHVRSDAALKASTATKRKERHGWRHAWV